MQKLNFITSNLLAGVDPFEFRGSFGEPIDPIREVVFANLTSMVTLQQRSGTPLMIHGKEVSPLDYDLNRGPSIGELMTPEHLSTLSSLQRNCSDVFTSDDLASIYAFVEKYKEIKPFYFFRHGSQSYVAPLDKRLLDNEMRNDLSILGSCRLLVGESAHELNRQLLREVFSENVLRLAYPEEQIKPYLINPEAEKQIRINFGTADDYTIEDFAFFARPAGQIFSWWLYQATNLNLACSEQGMINGINTVKTLFANTYANPYTRARTFRDRVLSSDTHVVFTQEADAITPQVFCEDGAFLPVDRQRKGDGCYVLLRSDVWDPNYEVIPLEGYKNYSKGRLNVVLATTTQGDKFLLASGHGDSNKAEDGREQLNLIVDKYEELLKDPAYEGLQLMIGMDANTKRDVKRGKDDVVPFLKLVEERGLQVIRVGPTTVKERVVTAQYGKALVISEDEEDWVIYGGDKFKLSRPTVGFDRIDPEAERSIAGPLPNKDNLSDHFAIGASLKRKGAASPSGTRLSSR